MRKNKLAPRSQFKQDLSETAKNDDSERNGHEIIAGGILVVMSLFVFFVKS